MQRVFITGIGTINPLAHTMADTWKAIQAGKVGIAPIQGYDTDDRRVKVAAEVKDFNAEDYFDRKEARQIDPYIAYARVAAKEAAAQAGFTQAQDPFRVGSIVSSGIGGIGTIEDSYEKISEKHPIENRDFDRVSPFFITRVINNMAAAYIAMDRGAKGVCEAVTTACSSSTNAIGNAYRLIRHGYMDAMFCGGAEASIKPLSMGGFSSMRAMSQSEDPKRASIPFDADRHGFVMGEGAAILFIESEASMTARGATPLAEIVGFGTTCDAYHITAPDPEAFGILRAMDLALKEAGIKAQDIDYINCHGTSTPLNDKTEAYAIGQCFGESIESQPYASSTKSMTGHLLGAAGALEAAICVCALQDGELPVNQGYEKEDPDAMIHLVTETGQKADLTYAMTNNLGFGGHNASLILKGMDQ